MANPPSLKEEHFSHTVRLSKDLNQRMLFRASQRHNGCVQKYMVALITRDSEAEIPDCNVCGYRIMGELLVERLREER